MPRNEGVGMSDVDEDPGEGGGAEPGTELTSQVLDEEADLLAGMPGPTVLG